MDTSDQSDDQGDNNFQMSVVDFTPSMGSISRSLTSGFLDDTFQLLNTSAFDADGTRPLLDGQTKTLILQEKMKSFESGIATMEERKVEIESKFKWSDLKIFKSLADKKEYQTIGKCAISNTSGKLINW